MRLFKDDILHIIVRDDLSTLTDIKAVVEWEMIVKIKWYKRLWNWFKSFLFGVVTSR